MQLNQADELDAYDSIVRTQHLPKFAPQWRIYLHYGSDALAKINLENKSVNDTLTAELERYKEQIKILKEGQNVDLTSKDNVLDSCAHHLKSLEISDLNASLQEKVMVITALKKDLRKLKGKALVDNDVTKYPSDLEMLKIDVEPITPKLYAKRIQELPSTEPSGTAHVQHSKLNANSELKCVKCNGCMLSDNHDLCVLDFINNVNARKKSKSVNKSSKRN
ncbi:hypothetical protein Tco_0397012 [Tanacetum coccineum]